MLLNLASYSIVTSGADQQDTADNRKDSQYFNKAGLIL
jgi:hypothetical protein